MPTENMAIWKKVCFTDPKHTKEANNGRFSFTNVDPTWQLQKATELWGPYGDKWGLFNLNFVFMENHETAMLEATFRYPGSDGSGKVEFPVAVDLKFRTNDDCVKKLITSARSKALSYLGFSADVYLGQFDDVQYVNRAKVRYSDMSQFVTDAMVLIKKAKSKDQLDKIRKSVDEMLADETITMGVHNDLWTEIDNRGEEVSGSDKSDE